MAQRARNRVGPVVEPLGGGADALLGRRWNRLRTGRAIEHQRHRRRRQPEVIGEHLERDAWPGLGLAGARRGAGGLVIGKFAAQLTTSPGPN